MSRFQTPKTNKKKKKFLLLIIFCITFGVTLFAISQFLKAYTPAVDVNIGQETVTEVESDFYQEANIDDRLKWIQFEDNVEESPVVAEVQDTSENKIENTNVEKKSNKTNQQKPVQQAKEEPVFSPKNIYKNDEKTNFSVPIVEDYEPPVPKVTEVVKSNNNVQTSTKKTKVYVGYYLSMTEANKVKHLISADFPAYNPAVISMNNQYIVQIATFEDRTKAVILQMDLADKGFPARLQTF
ncbi:MAG: hypothetical protein ACI37Z_04910 [Candidatus Gastranaerophilaceae bacterium]